MKRIMVLCACLMMLMSTTMVSMALGNEKYTYVFELDGGGNKNRTSAYKKAVTGEAALIEIARYINLTGKPLWYRLRSGANDTAASQLYGINNSLTQKPDYYYSNDYGVAGRAYYWRVQTDSSTAASSSATISGQWRP